ncbi:hypothetical protein Ciccas_005589 [Cichlidogyrus casuarinus]|uniref:Annexin n=1 Tax=Cichlidogyrus casuarinus TaxID=1844966 RepID=A0ABD2Q884_9PLAT
MNAVSETASLTVPQNFNVNQDAEDIHTAMSHKNEADRIINILGHRTASMRLSIRKAYAEKFHEDLLTAVYNSKYSSEFVDLLISLLIGPIGMLARELRKKLDKESVDEILCTANGWELREIQASYEALTSTEEFRKDTKNSTLESAINGKIKDGLHRDYLLKLLRGSRDEVNLEDIRVQLETRGNTDALINIAQVNQDVEKLRTAGKPQEEVFVEIISKRSNLHLKKMYDVFAKPAKLKSCDFLLRWCYHDDNLFDLVMAAVDQKLLLVAQLYNAMKGFGTKEQILNRIICLRSEHDMALLKVLFEERIGKDLGDEVYSETSGDYRTLLMVLLNSSHHKK